MGVIIHKEPRHPVKTEAKKMAWIVIQSSDSPDPEGSWMSLMPADVPEWVKEEDNITRMMEGNIVCWDPAQGCRWYRAYEVKRPKLS